MSATPARHLAAAIASAGASWRMYAMTSTVGEGYLARRGLDAKELRRRGLVRFNRSGDPVVALWSSRGEVVNCVRRCLNAGRRWTDRDGHEHEVPKVLGMKGHPTAGTLVGRIDRGRELDVPMAVITEGVIDTLTACLAWPSALVLGAHGAGRLALIAKVVAPLVRAHRAQLLLVPHDDAAGGKALVEAVDEATNAWLTKGADLTVIDLPHKDLNEAWQAGWRP